MLQERELCFKVTHNLLDDHILDSVVFIVFHLKCEKV